MRYENLVFGATLDSLLFALKRGYPVVYAKPSQPPFYEPSSLQSWKTAYFFLSLAGLVPFSDKVVRASIITPSKKLSILTERKRFEVEYGHLYLFDDSLTGMPTRESITSTKVLVHDYLDARGILPPELTDFDTSHDFVKSVKFFQSDRADRPDLRDVCAISILEQSDLGAEKYSELYTRFRVEQLLSEKKLEKQVKLESRRRDITPLGRAIYPPHGDITIVYDKHPIVWASENAYLSFLMESMNE